MLKNEHIYLLLFKYTVFSTSEKYSGISLEKLDPPKSDPNTKLLKSTQPEPESEKMKLVPTCVPSYTIIRANV